MDQLPLRPALRAENEQQTLPDELSMILRRRMIDRAQRPAMGSTPGRGPRRTVSLTPDQLADYEMAIAMQGGARA